MHGAHYGTYVYFLCTDACTGDKTGSEGGREGKFLSKEVLKSFYLPLRKRKFTLNQKNRFRNK